MAIISRIAEAANVSETWVGLWKRGRGKISLDHFPGRFQGLVDKVSKIGRYIDESIYLDYLVVLIAQFAEEGDVVIMGRGSQYILQDHPDAIHVLLVNSLENRVERYGPP
ncbi:MAG: cytidylate kinase family protein [Desulfobacterales bacterium]